MVIDIGKIVYDKFYDTLTNNDRAHLPKWEECHKPQQDAWRAAALAVCNYINGQKE